MQKVERLRKNEQFRKVFQSGKAYVGDMVVVYALENALPYNRVGITVSRKLGGAVERNHLKRIMREAWRACQGDLRMGKGFDLVLTPRMKAKTASFREISNQLHRLLVKADIVETDGEKSDIAQEVRADMENGNEKSG
ncbi:MAG TPA: ribonuclease P protein component [Bacillota bacterium]|jgi:ribonuclease P protein component|nr:ribonuclease P protein component [Bacillota bacterium]NLD11915.1 ribonuclease P protein component [Bacillota bacterium]HAV21664.1 ribonuclease P protein component [Bacillota bacterium]HCD41991.1 ribonuclease P protein component [Bacillota bacterium]HOB89254.1 ribonuclease P protein component [Bacillota bacterium]